MKTLQQLYYEDPVLYMQMAQQANKEQKTLSVRNDALFLQEIPLPDLSDMIQNIRKIRNEKLSLSDWTQLPDINLTTEKKEQWKTYRQKLRDLTMQSDFPQNIEWPVQP